MRREHLVAPLDHDLREALEVERTAIAGPDDAKARVFDRVAGTLGLAAGMSAFARDPEPDGPATPLTTKRSRWTSPYLHLVTFALGSAAGVLGWRSVHPPSPAPVVYVEREPIGTSSAPASPSAPTAEGGPAPAVQVPPRATSRAFATEPSGDSLAAERALLEAARSAYGRGEPDAALAALARHEKAFPGGQLSEEREALAIRSLVLAGRESEARSRAERFRKRYPTSVMLPAVEASLEGP
jgi:hypothetical protein